ncbi:MAG: tetratricopeptide repeat protein [Deltaproteobacteria bacterium]|nr:tetratricopeptide repeat protein [Deltaproteobacteria bacterium]
MKRANKRRQKKQKRTFVGSISSKRRSSFPVDSWLGKVAEHQRGGHLKKAEQVCKKILKAYPNHPDASIMLSRIFYESGRDDKAMDFIAKAIKNNPRIPGYHACLGMILQDQEKYDEAISCYREALHLSSDYTEAYNSMGDIFVAQRRLDDAIACYHKALRLRPGYAEFYFNKGDALLDDGKPHEAIACYQNVLRLPVGLDYPEAYHKMGDTFLDEGKSHEAMACYETALRLDPDCPETHYRLGLVFEAQIKPHEAMACYENALRLKPDYSKAHYRLGIAYGFLGKHVEEIACYQKALELDSNFAEAYRSLGGVFQYQGRPDEALRCYDKALNQKADPGLEVRKCLLIPVVCESTHAISQHRKEMVSQIESLKSRGLTLQDPYKQVGFPNFLTVYHGLNDKEIQTGLASLYLESCQNLSFASESCLEQRQIHDKIKIGIISNYLFGHTIGRLNHGIIRHLSRDSFDVTLFRFPKKEDSLLKTIDEEADEVVVLKQALPNARQKIAEHSLDILFYLDIGMDPLTYFLAFSRLAPVQCVTWGHPVTTGIPNIDYFISSENAEPAGAEKHYTENLVQLKRLGTYYYRPKFPKKQATPEKYGLPGNRNLYLCPQSLFKFHPDFDGILGTILREDSRSLLVLIEGNQAHWSQLLKARFARHFPDAVDRVQFLPRMPRKDFLSLLTIADVLLDTVHFGGGNTTLEGFAAGVPTVTLPGRFLRGRLTLALYRQMNIMDCVADSPESYVNIALRIANDKKWRQEITGKIKARANLLFKDIEAVRELERFFKWAVEVQDKKRVFES